MIDWSRWQDLGSMISEVVMDGMQGGRRNCHCHVWMHYDMDEW
jgi:hypothetical protein